MINLKMRRSVEMPAEREARIAAIREQVVGMYDRVPSPGEPHTDNEMGWRHRVLGVSPEDFTGKRVLDVGCGAGDYAIWHATHGVEHITGIDLSTGSLARAKEKAKKLDLKNVSFVQQDALNLDFPTNHFDYSYSMGVLHHTGDTFRGVEEMVRVTKPGGVVIVSLYNLFTRFGLRNKQILCKWLGGDDIDARARWGRRLFPFTMRSLTKRYYGEYHEAISYDLFGYPHETLHSASEVLNQFDRIGVEYIGSFAPLRLRDYLYTFSLPEYGSFRRTFDGFPFMRMTGDALAKLSARLGQKSQPPFPRPGWLDRTLCQIAWLPFSTRFQCFTIAGRKIG